MAPSLTPHATKGYHRECTGQALKTVQAHSELPPSAPQLTIFGAAFCPFVHRVWIALEHLQIPYRYVEVDPYEKPKELLEVNEKGLVPSLRIIEEDGKARGLGESTVILEWLNERFVESNSSGSTRRLLPAMDTPHNIYLRSQARLVAHHLSNKSIPTFYRFLQAQEPEKQVEAAKEFTDELRWFENRLKEADGGGEGGPFFGGGKSLGWIDVTLAPWAFRATNVLKHYRSLDLSSPNLFPPGSRYDQWASAVFETEAFKNTTSTEQLYIDSYLRYSENRPHTSQVADAINSGKALP